MSAVDGDFDLGSSPGKLLVIFQVSLLRGRALDVAALLQ